MTGVVAALAAGAATAPCTFNGVFTTTAAPSSGRVTTATRTIDVPPGNSGAVTFVDGAETPTVGFEYQKNGGAWTGFDPFAGDGASMADGDTLAFRTTGATSGEQGGFSVRDGDTNRIIEAVVITAS